MTGPVASLNTAWFALIGLLWTGYFVLEGFDFGVGMLSLAIGRDDVDRRLARNAIGPVWDGNEVWLIVAVAVAGGLASLTMFLVHGATFLSLKTAGPLAARARRVAMWLAVPAAALVVGTAAWLSAPGSGAAGGLPGTVPVALAVVCAVAFGGSGLLVLARRDGLAFGLSALGIAAVAAAVFAALFPRVMASTGPGPALTIWSAASAHQTLLVMSVVAAIFVPLVLAYQGWSFWVFRQRLVRPAARPEFSSAAPGPAASAAAPDTAPAAGLPRPRRPGASDA